MGSFKNYSRVELIAYPHLLPRVGIRPDIPSFPSSRVPRSLRRKSATALWDCGFESFRGHEYLSLMRVKCSQIDVYASGRSLVRVSRTECGVFEGDLETSTIRRSWSTRAVEP